MSRPMSRLIRHCTLAAGLLALGACGNTVDRLKGVGEEPKLSAIENPVSQPGYRPVQMPMPDIQPVQYSPNSLWQSGSRTFFKDQRARNIGDILTVKVRITDNAKLANSTQRNRSGSDDLSLEGAIGNSIVNALPGDTSADAIIGNESTSSSAGSGTINRSEAVTTDVAAVVTQLLPNGNLVIEGRQEVRVNFEMRQLIIAGVVRPEDIGADNTVDSSKIAEARFAYGGKGQISDLQQPRYGQQVMDILLPF
ncbi:flagellar basal body L-ring protein FlgH [Methylobrevis pamukkalensis]|uniref:Flagellar L-ring protein n=1 Tax=Methylobrevis pamukkalensis TaxID=1439726 RepID=A0A1E3GZ31_9HYPH|nr:flagellar basal body L-ring protein FlgH [Methylobrevis pamukkalensis]ODN69339.1 Flagellar L-ring protein precursor [Methylobrevis pamukkalensis]